MVKKYNYYRQNGNLENMQNNMLETATNMNGIAGINNMNMTEINSANTINTCNTNSEYVNCDECGFNNNSSTFPEDPVYGQSYVPIQQLNQTYKPSVGLQNGTIFPELVSPYKPGQSIAENQYIAMRPNTRREANN